MLKDKKGQQIVPFRESKLTRLFKNYFVGIGKSSLIVCLSQAPYLYDESVHVCKFASIASKVTVETYKEPPPKRKVSNRFSVLMAKERNKVSMDNSKSFFVGGRNSIAWESSVKNRSILGKSMALPSSFNPNARSTIRQYRIQQKL